jgi:hypothetical protein
MVVSMIIIFKCESHELEQHKGVVRSLVQYLKNKRLVTCKTTTKTNEMLNEQEMKTCNACILCFSNFFTFRFFEFFLKFFIYVFYVVFCCHHMCKSWKLVSIFCKFILLEVYFATFHFSITFHFHVWVASKYSYENWINMLLQCKFGLLPLSIHYFCLLGWTTNMKFFVVGCIIISIELLHLFSCKHQFSFPRLLEATSTNYKWFL